MDSRARQQIEDLTKRVLELEREVTVAEEKIQVLMDMVHIHDFYINEDISSICGGSGTDKHRWTFMDDGRMKCNDCGVLFCPRST